MKGFLQRLAYRLQTFMYGRYGYDSLSRALSWVSIVLILLSVIVPILYPVAFALFIWSIFRTYSKNIAARRRELAFYEKHFGLGLKRLSNMWRDRKTHRYYKCPSCKAYLRVPKGKGEIIITCPNCKTKIEKRT